MICNEFAGNVSIFYFGRWLLWMSGFLQLCCWQLRCYFFFCRNFCIRRDFITNPSSLKKRLMAVGFGMLLISPFLVIFMLVYLFLRHAEQFYNHPSTASSRRWSNLSKWIFREFNEVLLILSNLYFFPISLCATLHLPVTTWTIFSASTIFFILEDGPAPKT